MVALALADVFDRLPIAAVTFDVQRNDEFDTLGSGDLWQAELAVPLWTAEIALGTFSNDRMTEVAAIIRSLDGARQSFLCCDIVRQYPLSDPDGTQIAGSIVTIREIGADRVTARMAGLPAGYRLSAGDKLQVTYGGQIAFVEVTGAVVASGTGTLDAPIFPRLPVAVQAGMIVTLVRPACPMIIVPQSHNPGEARRSITSGARFKVIQKRRI